jgi:hypothetical protein
MRMLDIIFKSEDRATEMARSKGVLALFVHMFSKLFEVFQKLGPLVQNGPDGLDRRLPITASEDEMDFTFISQVGDVDSHASVFFATQGARHVNVLHFRPARSVE